MPESFAPTRSRGRAEKALILQIASGSRSFCLLEIDRSIESLTRVPTSCAKLIEIFPRYVGGVADLIREAKVLRTVEAI